MTAADDLTGMEQAGWRIAWFSPVVGHWKLAVYAYRDQQEAQAMADFLVTGCRFRRAVLIECLTHRTDHGAEGRR